MLAQKKTDPPSIRGCVAKHYVLIPHAPNMRSFTTQLRPALWGRSLRGTTAESCTELRLAAMSEARLLPSNFVPGARYTAEVSEMPRAV